MDDMLGRTLPTGVTVRTLTPHPDDRGVFMELHRDEWALGTPLVQWNAVRSVAGVLRGVHVHVRHDDYVTVPIGRATIGLRDLRTTSPTWGAVALVEIGERKPRGIVIPRGVAHGFLFHEPSVHVYAVSNYFDPTDELSCRFDDPDLEIPWPTTDVVLSARDDTAPPFAALVEDLAAHAKRRM